MVWWLFKKRDDEAHKKIDHMHNSIKSSFTNIKKDIEVINNHLKNHSSNSESFHKRLLAIEKKLDQFGAYLIEDNEKNSKEEEELPEINKGIIIDSVKEVLKSLTSTQKKVFLTIYDLQKEIKQPVSIKSLTGMIYRDKEYNQVRSMMSEYISLLTEFNLIDKKRVGRNTYVLVTEKGLNIIKKAKLDKKKIKAR